jgi:hypothetical protein
MEDVIDEVGHRGHIQGADAPDGNAHLEDIPELGLEPVLRDAGLVGLAVAVREANELVELVLLNLERDRLLGQCAEERGPAHAMPTAPVKSLASDSPSSPNTSQYFQGLSRC